MKKQTRLTLLTLVFVLSVLLLVGVTVFPQTAHAAPLVTVTNLNDSGAGSLREAIAAVDPGGTIEFSVSGTIVLGSELVIDKNLTIDGGNLITVSGNNATRVFNVTAGNVTFDSLTIVNGNSPNDGGGIRNGSTLTVNNSTLSGNSADDRGGGIYNTSTLTVNNSTLSSNSAYDGGGIFNTGMLTVNNSALSGNSATARGGGIFSSTASGSCTATPRTIIRNSTLSNNSANIQGGGIYNYNGVTEISNSTITTNTAISGGGVGSYNDGSTCTRVGGAIIAGNTGNDVAADSTTQRFFSLGHNLIGTAGANVNFTLEFNQTGDMTNTAPSLGALADNGGPTLTHRPNSGSLAIDNGAADCGVTIDQRGAERPYNGNCDIGAVETHPIAENCTLTTNTDLPIGDLTFNVGNWGTLACIKVENMGMVNHLLATTGIQTGQWWHVFGEDSDGDRVTSGFVLALTLPHAVNPHTNAKVCKFPGTQGGYGWDCFRTGSDGSTVWLDGVSSFSDWAVGNDVGPTAVTLQSLTIASQQGVLAALVATLLIALSGAYLWLRRPIS